MWALGSPSKGIEGLCRGSMRIIKRFRTQGLGSGPNVQTQWPAVSELAAGR